MTCTINVTTPRWEMVFGVMLQLRYVPVFVSWSKDDERGLLFNFLFLTFRVSGKRGRAGAQGAK